jgi:predicted acetyltransferase
VLIFDRFGGVWEINEFQYNKPAVSFWRRVVSEYTNGRYRESLAHGELRQVFQAGRRGRAV